MIPGVSVTLVNGQIGGAQNTDDGVVAQIITGAGTGAIALLQPCKFVSLADAVAQGLTINAEPEAYQFVEDFYNDAPIGSVLYLMLASQATSLVSLADKTNASGAIKLINFAIGNAGGQIRVLGLSRTPNSGYTPSVVEFIDSDAVLAGTNAQALVAAMFAAHTPLRILIGARVAAPSNTTVFAPNTAALNGIGYTIGGSKTSLLAATITTPGTTYTNGTYNNVPAVNVTGSGSGATFKVVVAGAVVTSVTPQALGTGYKDGDTFGFAAGFDTGTAVNFVGTVSLTGLSAGSAGMGTILAKVAATAPQQNIGRVKDGALSVNGWYIGALPITPPAGTGTWYQQLNTLIGAGYITSTTYPGKAGYFVSDDPMATSASDDYQSLANCRVIDKASILAYHAFLNYVNDDVDLVAGGTIDPSQAKDIESQIVSSMALGLSGNISGTPQCTVSQTTVLSAGVPLPASIRITPKGYLKQINVNLGFTF